MVYVSVAEDLLVNAAAHDYATMLAKYLSGVKEVSGWLGCQGRFERNMQAMESGIWKLHILPLNEKPWPANVMLHNRKSDNYLVYAQHWYYENHYQVVAVVIPDAHSRIDRLLDKLVHIVEDSFQCLNERELRLLNHVSA
ncbi:hypothetical protein TI10_01390 [Photorhabdus luminescens subsp. luminescens]|uniref:Toxin YafO, type II toxin-antitoxin system n=1 Tax=Photorhabdus luminescens TaxID=29488 RepID=A0A1G5RGR6_PHOLU|nr:MULTISPECIES: type II toxin-antitoxin system YafO family toxin [Photorhabdus]KMW74469.1 hypothetical protein TI10_01390 [Photorhabdus luminescens subsp. luminescens]MCW7546507.1 type II toxin-antitoxin system YafO family toxin [Photorhabdus aballayi]SCZ73285.1 Toxin YafO, type II toxin-antitoxin system [Photorhabdus luminescens]